MRLKPNLLALLNLHMLRRLRPLFRQIALFFLKQCGIARQ